MFNFKNVKIMSLKLKVRQVQNPNMMGYPKWYSSVSYEKKQMDIESLAEHMAQHNTPFSQGVIKGILTDFVNCVREQCLLGRRVLIDNLAIFKIGVQTTGADTYAQAKQRSMIKRVKLNIFAEGEFTSTELKDADIEWLDEYDPEANAVTPDDDQTPSDDTTSGGESSGSTTGGESGSSTTGGESGAGGNTTDDDDGAGD